MNRLALCCEIKKLEEADDALQEEIDLINGGGGGGGGDVTYLPAVTGYTGGGATKLDGVATVALSVDHLYAFRHATEGGRFYLLRAGTDAANSPAIIRPLDYNGATNAKVWESFL